MLIAIFIILLMMLGVIAFAVFEPRIKRKHTQIISEKDKKAKERLSREINNFLAYTGDKQN